MYLYRVVVGAGGKLTMGDDKYENTAAQSLIFMIFPPGIPQNSLFFFKTPLFFFQRFNFFFRLSAVGSLKNIERLNKKLKVVKTNNFLVIFF